MGSPSVDRAVQVLDFLTTHPGRGFTLSELSRRLGMSKATAHGILSTLTERALLQRHPDTNEYRLGPALVPMGQVAERSFPALPHARREAERLAEEYDAECVIVMAIGEETLIIGRAGVPGPHSLTAPEGQRQPLAPPLGSIVLAWTDDHAVEAWLDRLGPELTDADRARHRAAVEAIRRRGYAVSIRVPRLEELLAHLRDSPDLHSPAGRREISRALAAVAHDEYLPADEPPPDAELSAVTAPVFGSDGALLFAIALMPDGRRGRDVPVLARAVLRAAGRVMAAIDGRPPALGAAPARAAAGLTPRPGSPPSGTGPRPA
jgi:DNA-binding IclR family transcriptional regulator